MRRSRSVAVAVLIGVSCIGTFATAAVGSVGNIKDGASPPATGTDDGAVITISTGHPGSGGPTRPTRPSPWVNCTTVDIGMLPGLVAVTRPLRPIGIVDPQYDELERIAALPVEQFTGVTDFRICDRVDGSGPVAWLLRPGANPDPTPSLIIEAERVLVLPEPQIATSPPTGSTQPVGLPVWFWATNAATRTESASVPGTTVTVRAVATGMELVIEEPSGRRSARRQVTVDCQGTGVAFDAGKDRAWSGSKCSHVFDWPGPATVQATVTWRLTWSSTSGMSGTLPPVTRTSSVTLRPVELQAVTD